MSGNISLPEPSEGQKIRGAKISWVSVFLVDKNGNVGKELKVVWLAETGTGLGLYNASEDTLNVWIEFYIPDCDTKYWGYQTQIAFTKRDKDDEKCMVFHIIGNRPTLDFGTLLRLKIKNQGKQLSIQEILEKNGLKESSHTPKKKRKEPFRFTSLHTSMIVLALLGGVTYIHYGILDHVETGTVATRIVTQEIPLTKGLVEDILEQGSEVRKGGVLARVVDPNLTGNLGLLEDKRDEAIKREQILRNQIEAQSVDLQNKKAMLEESRAYLQKRKDLEKQGFISSSLILLDKQKVLAEESGIATISTQIQQAKVELQTLLNTWGPNFTKLQKQKGELQKQTKGSTYLAKCDCYVYSVASDVRAITFQLIPKDHFYIEAALPKDTVAHMKDGQVVWFTLPGSSTYKKGVYKITELQRKDRMGLSGEIFAATKMSIIVIKPDEPISGGVEIIGKPVALMLHTSSVSATIERIKIYFTANF